MKALIDNKVLTADITPNAEVTGYEIETALLDKRLSRIGKLVAAADVSYIEFEFPETTTVNYVCIIGHNFGASATVKLQCDADGTWTDLILDETLTVDDVICQAIPTANVTRSYALRDTGPAGGWIFYYDTPNNLYYECATSDVFEAPATDPEWGSYNANVAGTSSALGSGSANTDLIVAWLDANIDDTYGDVTKRELRAAYLCYDYSEGGYSDWFMPSFGELFQVYTNLYLESVPGFNTVYWASDQNSPSRSDGLDFSSGLPTNYEKNTSIPTRPIRSFTPEVRSPKQKYWRLHITDAGNANPEISYIFLGESVTFPAMETSQVFSYRSNSEAIKTFTKQIHGNIKTKYKGAEISFPIVTETERQTLISAFDIVDTINPFVLLFWENDLDIEPPLYCNFKEAPDFKRLFTEGLLWASKINIEECR